MNLKREESRRNIRKEMNRREDERDEKGKRSKRGIWKQRQMDRKRKM